MVRGTETEEVIKQRLLRAREEAVYMNDYDYIVLNETGNADACVASIHRIICDQQDRVENCGDFIQKMADDLKNHVSQ